MGSYQDRLTADMKVALKSGAKDRLTVLRMLISALKDEQIKLNRDLLTEAEETAILRRAVVTRKDTIDQAKAGNRQDIVDKESAEVALIETYLPARLSGPELLAKIKEVATSVGYSGPADTSKFMKEWMGKYKDLADGKEVQQALKSL